MGDLPKIDGLVPPAALPKVPSQGSKEQMVEAAKKFESFFVSEVFRTAFETIPEEELIGGKEQSMFQSMFINKVAEDSTARGHGLGLADDVLRQMEAKNGDKKQINLKY